MDNASQASGEGTHMSRIPFHPASDDCPHVPQDDPLWQESALFVWYDRTAGVGGFWRLGQEPVVSAANSCFGMFTADGLRFRANVTGAPMAKSDRGETWMGLGPGLRVDLDGPPRIAAAFPECEARLRFQDFHPRYEYAPLSGAGPLGGAAHHFEVSGAVTGEVRIGERQLKVNALGYRDRSWGPRTWGTIRGTRWWPCVFGPDLAVHVLNVITGDGQFLRYGYVFRDGATHAIVDSDMVVEIESDAMTPRRGQATLRLDNGETLTLACEPADGIVMHVRGYTAVESIGTAYLGDRVGISDLEVCTNAGGGDRPPVFAINSNLVEGLSRR